MHSWSGKITQVARTLIRLGTGVWEDSSTQLDDTARQEAMRYKEDTDAARMPTAVIEPARDGNPPPTFIYLPAYVWIIAVIRREPFQ